MHEIYLSPLNHLLMILVGEMIHLWLIGILWIWLITDYNLRSNRFWSNRLRELKSVLFLVLILKETFDHSFKRLHVLLLILDESCGVGEGGEGGGGVLQDGVRFQDFPPPPILNQNIHAPSGWSWSSNFHIMILGLMVSTLININRNFH